jgi:hypothetical protein
MVKISLALAPVGAGLPSWPLGFAQFINSRDRDAVTCGQALGLKLCLWAAQALHGGTYFLNRCLT